MVTRRRLLGAVPLLALAARDAFALNPFRRRVVTSSPFSNVYIGCDTAKGVSKGIYRARFNRLTGHMEDPVLVATTPRPCYLAFGPGTGVHRALYVANELGAADSAITTFAVDLRSGDLREAGRVSSGFAGPCYVAVDATGHSVFVANYAGGGVSSYRIEQDGTLSQPVERVDYHDTARFGEHGPNAERQDGPHPHCTILSPDNRFLVVCDLGNDRISVFGVDAATGQLRLGEPHLFGDGRPGAGPRHVAFHPNQRWIYCVNELDSSIDHYLWTTTHTRDSSQALLVDTHTPVKTIAGDFPADRKNTAAEIAISPDGFHLYVSNRGEDSLAVFTIDQASGALKPVQRISCGGKTPRQFALDPGGMWLLCGNQDSASVTVFRRDAASGQLAGPVQTVNIDSPLVTIFA